MTHQAKIERITSQIGYIEMMVAIVNEQIKTATSNSSVIRAMNLYTMHKRELANLKKALANETH